MKKKRHTKVRRHKRRLPDGSFTMVKNHRRSLNSPKANFDIFNRTSSRKRKGYQRIHSDFSFIEPADHNVNLENWDVVIQRVGDNAGKPFIYHKEAPNGVLYETPRKRFRYYHDLAKLPAPKLPDNAIIVRTNDREAAIELTKKVEKLYSETPHFYIRRNGTAQKFITQKDILEGFQEVGLMREDKKVLFLEGLEKLGLIDQETLHKSEEELKNLKERKSDYKLIL